MKYKAQVIYKGIEVNAKIGTEHNTIQVPGDVEINIEGECSPVESFMYFRAINQLVKLGTK
jgi:hypothetical protein